jgi:hypothetical protein
MLQLPSLMTENSFWSPQQRLLTSNRTKIFVFNESNVKDILVYQDKAQIPSHQREEKTEKKGGGVSCKNLPMSR